MDEKATQETGGKLMIPVYGFLEGDSLGLLIFAYEYDSISELANKVAAAASVRVLMEGPFTLKFAGENIEDSLTVKELGLQPLDMIEVIPKVHA